MPHTPVPSYDFGQQTLYSIAKDIYISLAVPANLADFAALKPTKYTVPYLNALRLRLTTASEMPDDTQRNEEHETDKIQLVRLNKTCTRDFKILKTYIHDGFPKEEWTVKYNASGMVDNHGAESNNWNSVNKRNKKMNDFIAGNGVALGTGHMPVGFAAQVTTDTGDFTTKYDSFISAMHTGVGTGEKIDANNLVDADLKDLQNDAHAVYADVPTKLKLYMIEEVRLIVAPLGSASMEVELKEAGTNLPITIGNVIIQSLTGIAITQPINAEGIAKFDSIDPDRYSVKIIIPGRPEINTVKEVNTGANSRLKVVVPAV